MPSNAFSHQAQGLTFSIVRTWVVTPAFQSGGYSQRVATVSASLTVGFPQFDEPTVNSNCELTVAASRRIQYEDGGTNY